MRPVAAAHKFFFARDGASRLGNTAGTPDPQSAHTADGAHSRKSVAVDRGHRGTALAMPLSDQPHHWPTSLGRLRIQPGIDVAATYAAAEPAHAARFRGAKCHVAVRSANERFDCNRRLPNGRRSKDNSAHNSPSEKPHRHAPTSRQPPGDSPHGSKSLPLTAPTSWSTSQTATQSTSQVETKLRLSRLALNMDLRTGSCLAIHKS